MGEMADELLLAGQRALPARLQASGFSFDHPTFRDAARWALEEK
jgi:NAD dependent epimerase/dehydratase family enzyme